MNILVIEDDPVIGKTLVQGFTEAGHACDWAKNGISGSNLAATQHADVIVLDLMLPGRHGRDVLRELRGQGVKCPVIILSAVGDVEERVQGLDAGADDYVVKPFAFAELMARVQAVVRRTSARPPMVIKTSDLTLDLTTRRATRGEQEIDLTPTEFSMLELLMRYAGQVVTRKMLCEHVWGFDWDGPTNVIEVHINRLRRKLDKGRPESMVKTVRGRGYALPAS